jgi:Domain of unknown function (DUF6597)
VRCTLQLKPVSIVSRDVDAPGKGNEPGRVHAAGPAVYAEMTPPPDLASDILCLWTMRIDQDAGIFVQHLLPDLTVDVVSLNGGPLFVMGQPTSAMRLALQSGTRLAGVRLRAGVARRLLNCSPADLLDGIAPLDTVIRTRLRDAVASTEHSVHTTMPTLLRRQIAMDDNQADPVVRSAIDWLAGNSRVETSNCVAPQRQPPLDGHASSEPCALRACHPANFSVPPVQMSTRRLRHGTHLPRRKLREAPHLSGQVRLIRKPALQRQA